MIRAGLGRGGLLFLAQAISVSLIFTTSFILARHLSPHGYGDFSAAYSCVAIAYVVCLLGADITAFNFIAVAHGKGNVDEVNAYVRFVCNTVLAVSAVLYSLTLLSFLVARLYLHVEESHPALIAIIFAPLLSMTFFFYKVLTSMSRPVLSNMLYKVLLNLIVLIAIVAMIHSLPGASAGTAVVTYLAPWGLILAVFVVLFVKGTGGFRTRSEVGNRRWLVPGVSAMPYSVALMALANLGVIAAELFAPKESDVGHYAAATWVSQLFNTLFVSLAFTLYLSDASQLVDAGKSRELRALVMRHLRTMGAIGAVFMLIVVVFGKRILRLYGDTFVSTYSVLILLSLMQVIVVLCGLATPILNYMGRHTLTAAFSIVLVVAILPLAYVLHRYLGMAGIAASLLVAVGATFIPKQVLLMRALKAGSDSQTDREKAVAS